VLHLNVTAAGLRILAEITLAMVLFTAAARMASTIQPSGLIRGVSSAGSGFFPW
jgi:hypothetical protein